MTSHSATRPTTSREQEWLPLLTQGALEVFEIMLGTSLRTAEAAGLPDGENFTAMVGLAGSLRGVITFCCGSQAGRRIAARMLGPNEVCNEPQICDGLGEICNMVAGNFKNKLIGVNRSCLLSVPAVVTGNAYRFRSLAGGESLQTVLLWDGQPLIIRLDIHS
jgi:chemotaxis protein CheX